MKHGPKILAYLNQHSKEISEIKLDGRPSGGFLTLTLADGTSKTFDDWDEEDQGYFSCMLNGTQWKPSMRGIQPTLNVNTMSKSFSITLDKEINDEDESLRTSGQVNVAINDQQASKWGKLAIDEQGKKTYSKREPTTQPEANEPLTTSPEDGEEKGYCGFESGFMFKKR